MGLILYILKFHTPSILKKKGLQELTECVSSALDCPAPDLNGHSFNDSLRLFAQSTYEQISSHIMSGSDIEYIKKKLNDKAIQFGERYRKRFSIFNPASGLEFFKFLYKMINIEMIINSDNDLIINKCYFSSYYSKSVCEVMSAFDSGILYGLTDKYGLDFTSRITGGCEYCRAKLINHR
jgi:hypothetical protein